MVEKAGNLAFLPLGDGAADPDSFLNEVLNGWSRLQRSNDFGDGTIRSRHSVVMKLVDFSGHFPWQWTLGDADEFFSHARGVKNLSHSTVRTYKAPSSSSVISRATRSTTGTRPAPACSGASSLKSSPN